MRLTELLAIVGILLVTCSATIAKEQEDPFDLSEIDKRIEKLGVPTVSEVDALEQKAKTFYKNKEWKNAAIALEEYSKKANWLSNLISVGLEPYYDASRDDRKKYGYYKINKLIPTEKSANDYRQKRDIAMVLQAECLIKMGQKKKAVSLLFQALNLIHIENEEWWDRARKQLYKMIGYE